MVSSSIPKGISAPASISVGGQNPRQKLTVSFATDLQNAGGHQTSTAGVTHNNRPATASTAASVSLPSTPIPLAAVDVLTDGAPQTNSATPTSLETVENKIRAHVFAKRIRLTDLFADFDKLRCGYITASQFRRCLGGAMDRGVVSPLVESEYGVLIEHYKGQGEMEGRVKWVMFVDSIDKVFGAKKLEQTPTQYIPAPHEVVRPVRPPLSPKSESLLMEITERLRQYVKHHGSDVKTWFKDFDKHNNGYITLNQFRRGIPQNLLSQGEEDLLLGQYSDPVTGTVNYFKMNTDVNRKVRRARLDHAKLVAKLSPDHVENEHVPVGTEELLHAVGIYWPAKPSREQVEDHIKKQVYKERIRLIEFFKDYDRHNCGLVTEAQFRAGLRLSKLQLDELQINAVVRAYMGTDGRVAYRRFCCSIESVFTVSDLEKDPLAEVYPPARSYLVQGCNELSPAEEARCREIIARFRTILKERRLLLAPYFKDFDKRLGSMGRVTRSHFSRLLSWVNLEVSENDLYILFKKFEDRQMAKVNYMEFIRTIDPETYGPGSTHHAVFPSLSNYLPAGTGADLPEERPESPEVTLLAVMDKIRVHVATKRIRVSEFFRDFDKLRCYSIPTQEFVRGINRIGLTFTDEEYNLLVTAFTDEDKKGCCKWKAFERMIERVFTDTDLESQPTKVPTVPGVSASPYVHSDKLSDKEMAVLHSVVQSLANHLNVRETSIKPFLKDFDKLYTGNVTKTQFRQCLTYIKVFPTDAVFEVLCKRYSKSGADANLAVAERQSRNKDPIKDGAERICYLMFLKELEDYMHHGILPKNDGASNFSTASLQVASAAEYTDANKHLIEPQARRPKPTPILDGDGQEQLMMRIKTKAKSERIRVIDFMSDFDHLQHGKITKNEFRRALKVLFLNLTDIELATLESMFQCKTDPLMVDYGSFSDEIESVFTVKGLETTPLREPDRFESYEKGADPSINVLDSKEEEILQNVLKRFRGKVRQTRMDALSYFEDFDFVKEGTITTNQFRSVLNTISLPVSDEEIRVLARKFAVDRNMDRVNYRLFSSSSAS